MKKKSIKKGFTLIELLAVVVILVVIVLIATNAFISLMQNARKNSFINEIGVYVKNAESYYALENQKSNFVKCIVDDSGNKICPIDIKDLNGNYVDKKDKNYNGCILIKIINGDNFEYSISLSNGYFKYIGKVDDINEENVLHDDSIARCSDFTDMNKENQSNDKRVFLDIDYIFKNCPNSGALYSSKQIRFVNSIDTTNAISSWNVSADGSEDVKAWLELDADRNFILYIGSNKKIFAGILNKTLPFFSNFMSLEQISFNNFDTSGVKNMNDLFYGSSLQSIDLSSFDTSNVTEMRNMFYNVNADGITINLDAFDTSKVNDMSEMFSQSDNVTLILGDNFIISENTNTSNMFDGCDNLTVYLSKNNSSKNLLMKLFPNDAKIIMTN